MINIALVALNMSKLTVPEFVLKSMLFIKSISANPDIFKKPFPSLDVIAQATKELEEAWEAAADGSTIKKAEVAKKKRALYKLLKIAAQYVEDVANGEETIILLSSLSVKRKRLRALPFDFQVFLPDDLGAVGLKCRARVKSIYRWEFCKFTGSSPQFAVHHYTDVCSTFIGNLESSVSYWFRVVIINKYGEHALEPKSITPL